MSNRTIDFVWEAIYSDDEKKITWRSKVYGGWVLKEEYYTSNDNEIPIGSSMIFIPDHHHKWEYYSA